MGIELEALRRVTHDEIVLRPRGRRWGRGSRGRATIAAAHGSGAKAIAACLWSNADRALVADILRRWFS